MLLLLLFRLAAITLPILGLQACAELDVHSRRCGESERLGDLDKIQFVDVEYGAERVAGVGL